VRPAIANNRPDQSPLTAFFENALLTVTLSLLVLRATYIENPHVEQIQTRFFLTSEIVSLYMSTALLGCFALWLAVSALQGRLRWRRTYLGAGVSLFLAAGIIACLAASNKRAAVTDLVVLIAPMLTAMFLVQLLTSRQRVYLAILLVLAVSVAMTAQCIDQLAESTGTLIESYEQDPAEQLRVLGIEPDSLEHWMYEHRLYSKDIRGFLMTSNSAASFFLLAVFAGMGVCIEAFRQRHRPECLVAFVGYLVALLFGLGGLLLTQSKGGIGAFALAVMLGVVTRLFGERLWRHRAAVGIFLLAGVVLAVIVIAAYGIQHGRLPGGNSMLVRWQYWQSTIGMIADHAVTGVGGGNYGFLYPLYKEPAALETIRDPHNVVLSLLSQYGPLGLLGFLVAIFYPLYKSLGAVFEPAGSSVSVLPATGKKLWLALLGVSVCLFLFVRPMLIDANFFHERADVRSAAYVVLYVFPAGVFVLAFGLLGAVAHGDLSISRRNDYLLLSLIFGVTALLIHNLVDFAIFEPGVWGLLWLFAAMAAACGHHEMASGDGVFVLSGVRRLGAVVCVCAVFFGIVAVAVTGPVRANRLFRRALTAPTPQWDLVDHAIAADGLSPDTAYNAAGLLRQVYAQQRPSNRDISLLERAAEFAVVAQRRNPDGFKAYRLAADIALMRADAADGDEKTRLLREGYELLLNALDRYPGSDRIHYNLGQIAERLDRPHEALTHYRSAVAIEDAYQVQFKVMYPDRRPVISRLGNTAYTIARARIESLEKQLDGPRD
jgi:hypothetical protein